MADLGFPRGRQPWGSGCANLLLPPANEVWGKVISLQVCVCPWVGGCLVPEGGAWSRGVPGGDPPAGYCFWLLICTWVSTLHWEDGSQWKISNVHSHRPIPTPKFVLMSNQREHSTSPVSVLVSVNRPFTLYEALFTLSVSDNASDTTLIEINGVTLKWVATPIWKTSLFQ